MDRKKQLAKVRYWPTYRVHVVDACGGARDGSLFGFRTCCGMKINDDTSTPGGLWTEEASGTAPTCRRCDTSKAHIAAVRGDRGP